MRLLVIRLLNLLGLLGLLFPAIASAVITPTFAYVTSASSNTISAFTINPSTGALTAGTVLPTGSSPFAVSVAPGGKFAYVANYSSNSVSVYTLNPTNGALTAGTEVATGVNPSSVTVDSSGKFLYVANFGSNTVAVFTIDQTTGALTGGSGFATGVQPNSVAVAPNGKFAYVVNYGSNTVSVYTINQTTGALTAGPFVATGSLPYSITIEPGGKFAYVANNGSNTVSVYTINQTTGALTAGSSVPTGTSPRLIAIDPSGKFAYVVNESSATVSTYTINQTTGALTSVGAVATGTYPNSVSVDPSGMFVYVANYSSGTVSVFSINQTTGALTAGTPVTFPGAFSVTTVGSSVSAVPGAPTIGQATMGNGQATVNFTAPTNNGVGITGYTVTSTPGGITATGTASPITVSGLTNGISYTFTVHATNTIGNSVESAATNSVPPRSDQAIPRFIAPAKIFVSGTGNVFADATSGLPVSITSLTTNICTVSNGMVNGILAGTCTLAADQPGNASINPAPQVTQSFAIVSGVVVPTFAYVANASSNTVSVYKINPSTGALTAGTAVATGTSPRSVTVDPSGKFAYVANYSSNTVSVYTINPVTGALTAGIAVATGTIPNSVTVDPSGKFAYVANTSSNTVSVFTINPTTGALTAGTAVATGTTPDSVTVDPSGKFAYVANASSNTVSVYTINPATGALTAGTAVATGTLPQSVTVDSSGKFAYVANTGSNTVSVYTINQTTGALTAGIAVATGTTPNSVTVDPSGKFAYVANFNSNTVSIYTINPTTGALTAGTAVATGTNPWSVAVDPSGKFAYVENYGSDTSSVYTINQITGILTAGTAVSTGSNPTSIVTTGGVVTIPGAPTAVSATAGNTTSTVNFTAPTDNGGSAITGYTVTSSPDGITATGTASPILVTGLANGTSYTFTVYATNVVGNSAESVSTSSVTPLRTEQTIRFIAPTKIIVGGYSNVFADATSSLPVSMISLTQSICTVSNGTVNGVSAGTCTLTADQAGNATYNAAPQVTQSILIINGVVVPKFAYAANYTSNTVSVYTINPITGALTAGTAVATGTNPKSVTVDPSGMFAYVANYGSNTVSVYTINPSTGALTAGTAVATGTGPSSVTVDPSGKFAYVANGSSNTLSVYSINPTTGALTAGTAVATGSYPYAVTVDPSGKFAYVANANSNTVSVYAINPNTGALTAGTAVATGTSPREVVVDSSGRFAYVANWGSANISTYTINQATGALTAGAVALATGTQPTSVVIDLTGKFLYVTDNWGNKVLVYNINQATGALTAGTSVATGANPYFVAVDPSSKFAYVANYNNSSISVYSINSTTGALTAGAAVATGSSPYSVVTTGGVATVPVSPTLVSATAGNATATVSFTVPTDNGGSTITGYTVTSSPGGITATGTASPITVTGLTNSTAYTFTVTATNVAGTSSASAPTSIPVTPLKTDQTITFGIAPTLAFGTAGVVSATATSSLAVSFSSLTQSVCTVTNNSVVSLTGGTCTIAADQAGNAFYNAAPQKTQSILIPAFVGGTVTDLSSGAVITAATVSITGGASTQTATNGTYKITGVNPGVYAVTVSKTGYQTVTIPALSVTAQGASLNIQLTTPGLLNITTSALLPAQLGVAYNDSARANGGSWPYTYTLAYGTLPPGLTLDPAYGSVNGTPTLTGSYTFAVGLTDKLNAYAEKEYTLEVTQPLVFATTSTLHRGTLGVDYFQSITATGGTQPYTLSTSAGALPAGLVIAANGSITGKPTAIGTSQFTEKVTDASGRTAQTNFTLSVVNPLVVTTNKLNNGIVGAAYNQTLAASGGYGNYTWAVYSGTLPPGLALDSQTGIITGSPTAATYGIIVFSVTDADSPGRITYKDFAFTVANPLQILSSSVPNGLKNAQYSELIRLGGGIGPYTFSIASGGGTLPAGLTLNTTTGIISGTATAAGLTNVNITVTDSTWPTAQSVTQLLSIRVTSLLTVTSSAVLPMERKNTAISPITLVAQGGSSPYAWELVSGYMPQGMSLNPQTGELTGTPLDRGDFVFTVKATDALNATAQKDFFWHVSDTLAVASGAVADGAVGVPYSFTLNTTGGLPVYSWRLASGTLPTGLTLNGSTGTISGTPTTKQTFSFTVEVSDADTPAQKAQMTYVMDVLDTLFIYTKALPNGRINNAYTATVQAQLGTPPYSWRISSGVLPAGLTLDTSATVATVTGTPTASGTYTFTLEAKDSGTPALTATKQFTFDVYGGVLITSTGLKTVTRGVAYSDNVVVSGGALPYSYTVSSGALPAGLTLNSQSGNISGITNLPTGFSSAFNIKVADSGNPSGNNEKGFALYVVDPLAVTTTVIQGALQGSAYLANIVGSGGLSPYTWSIQGGALPAGLQIDPATGNIVGTTNACGLFNFTVQLSDAAPTPNTSLHAFDLNVTGCSGNPSTTYTVTPAAGTGGTISPSTAQTVNSGSAASFTVTPNSGFSVATVTGCGGLLSGNTYTTGAITGSCAVTASFVVNAKTNQTIGAISFTPATLAVNGTTTASATGGASGNPVTFTSTTTSICTVSGTNGNIVTGQAAGTCTIAANQAGNTSYNAANQVTQNITVSAPATSFTVSTTAGANGSINPASQNVTQGNTTSFTMSANTGYTASASGCGGSLAGSTYTTGAITANCTVNATFTLVGSGTATSVVSGWNLLGNSVNTPLDVTTVFSDATKVTSVWKWVAATSRWAFYSPSMTSGALVTYAAGKSYDVLDIVKAGEGFWVNASTNFTAQFPTGTSISTSYFQPQIDTAQNKLLSGWNLVATGDNVSATAFNQKLSTTPPNAGVIPQNLITLWAWDSGVSNWYFYSPNLEAQAGTKLTDYINSKSYLDFTIRGKILDSTTGFWVNKP